MRKALVPEVQGEAGTKVISSNKDMWLSRDMKIPLQDTIQAVFCPKCPTTNLSVTWAGVCVLPRYWSHLPTSGCFLSADHCPPSPVTSACHSVPRLFPGGAWSWVMNLGPATSSGRRVLPRPPQHLQAVCLSQVHSGCLGEQRFLGQKLREV